jgi:hypothetical protein
MVFGCNRAMFKAAHLPQNMGGLGFNRREELIRRRIPICLSWVKMRSSQDGWVLPTNVRIGRRGRQAREIPAETHRRELIH